MTHKQARSELEQLYMSLSEEKKKALDVAFKAMAQADGEYIPKEAVLDVIDGWYEDKADIEDLIVKITYMQGVAIPSAEPCEDAISRKALKHKLQEHHDFFVNAYGGFSNLPQNDKARVDEISNCIAMVVNEPSVKPQEPPTGHWIMRHRKVNTINYRTGEDVLTGEIHTVKELIRYETDEPYCVCCGKRAEDISQDYCGYCGAIMVEPQESEEINCKSTKETTELPDNMCTQRCCLKNHNLGIIECNEECYNRTLF